METFLGKHEASMKKDAVLYEIGESIVVVGTRDDGQLGTVIAVRAKEKDLLYHVVFETGEEVELSSKNIALRR